MAESAHQAERDGAEASRRASLTVMVATLGSRILGFVRSAVIAFIFGASGQADTLNLAFTVPNNLRKLLAEGALSTAFIPVLSGARAGDASGDRARRFLRGLLGVQLLILLPLTGLILVAPRATASVFFSFPDATLQREVSELLQGMILYLPLVSLSAILMATLQVHRRFLVPALTPLLFSIAVIGSVLVFSPVLGGWSMVLGVLAGGMLQVGIQVPGVLRAGYSLMPALPRGNEDLRLAMRRWLPVLFSSSLFTIAQQVAVRIASGLPAGSGSALSYGIVFYQLPFGVFSASIATVFFPIFAEQGSRGDRSGLARSASLAGETLFSLLLPSSVLLYVLAEPLVIVTLEGGQFTREASLLTAAVVRWYATGLVGAGWFNLLQRVSYARGDYRSPLYVSSAVVVLSIGLSLLLVAGTGSVVGLPIANSVSFTAGALLLFAQLRPRTGSMLQEGQLRSILGIGISSVALGIYAELGRRLLVPLYGQGRTLPAFAGVAALGLAGVGAYLLFLRIAGVTTVRALLVRGSTGKQ